MFRFNIKLGKTSKKIETFVGKSIRIIQREIKRGYIELLNSDLTKKSVYCADVAQDKYLKNRCNEGVNFKISNNIKLAEYIESKIINDKYSTDAIIGEIKAIFKSITMDNGNEFVNQNLIEKSCILNKKRTIAFYAHPYSSWEIGSNENANKLIRRFIPKGHKISKFTKKEINKVQEWINNYPRKILNYKSAKQYYEFKLVI